MIREIFKRRTPLRSDLENPDLNQALRSRIDCSFLSFRRCFLPRARSPHPREPAPHLEQRTSHCEESFASLHRAFDTRAVMAKNLPVSIFTSQLHAMDKGTGRLPRGIREKRGASWSTSELDKVLDKIPYNPLMSTLSTARVHHQTGRAHRSRLAVARKVQRVEYLGNGMQIIRQRPLTSIAR